MYFLEKGKNIYHDLYFNALFYIVDKKTLQVITELK